MKAEYACIYYARHNKVVQTIKITKYLRDIMLFKNKKRITINLLLYVATSMVHASTLNLDDFISKVIESNPGVQRILVEEEIAAAKLKSSYGIEDSVLSSSLSQNYLEPDQVSGKEATDQDSQKFSVSLDKKFANTGTQLLLSYQNTATEQQPPALIAGENYYQPSLTLQLTQPLLKNSDGIQDKLNINLDRLGLELTRLSVREELESYITQLATLYLDWYLAYEEMNILNEVYEQVVEQEKVVKLKVKRQVAEDYELFRIQETLQDYYSRWQQSIGKYDGLSRQLINQVSDSRINLSDKLIPEDPANSKIINADRKITRVNNYLVEVSRLKKILDLNKSQQVELLNAKSNAQKPELNLSVGYTRHGIGDDVSDAHANSNSDDYSIMLKYKKSIGNRAATGKYNEQVAIARKVEADTRQRLINARSSLESLSVQSERLNIAVDSSHKKISLAKRKLEQEYRLYKIGRLDLFQLLQDQKAQLESRVSQVQLQIQLLKLKLNIGELLDRNLDIYTSEKI